MIVSPSALPRLRGAFLLALALAVSLLFFRMIQGFVSALLLAAIFAGLSQATYLRIQKAVGGRKSLAAATTILLGVILVVVPLMVFLGLVVHEATVVSQSVGLWVDEQMEGSGELRQRLADLPLVQELAPYEGQIRAKLGELSGKAAGFVATSLAAGTKGTLQFFLMLFVGLYSMFFFLKEGPGLIAAVQKLLPVSNEDSDRMLGTFTSVTRATLKGTLVIGIVQGGLAGIAFAIAGIESAAFWSVVMAILSFLPGVGTALIWVPACAYLALDERTGVAVLLFLWCALVVGTIDNVLRPRLVGKDTEMPDLLVLLGTLGGLVLFGAVGIVVGPVIAALFLTVWDLYGSAVGDLFPGSGLGKERPAVVESAAGETES